MSNHSEGFEEYRERKAQERFQEAQKAGKIPADMDLASFRRLEGDVFCENPNTEANDSEQPNNEGWTPVFDRYHIVDATDKKLAAQRMEERMKAQQQKPAPREFEHQTSIILPSAPIANAAKPS